MTSITPLSEMKSIFMKAITVLIAHLFFMVITQEARADEIHVRPDGPMHTLAEAQRVARKTKAPVIIHAGTYYLPETLVFTEEDAGTEYRAADGDTVVISVIQVNSFFDQKLQCPHVSSYNTKHCCRVAVVVD